MSYDPLDGSSNLNVDLSIGTVFAISRIADNGDAERLAQGRDLLCAGDRFVDEGQNFRNYTYAQFGKAVLEQPGHFAWQIFDAKAHDLLYAEYRFHDASFVEADTLEELCAKLEGFLIGLND